jgi:hypothetical protein
MSNSIIPERKAFRSAILVALAGLAAGCAPVDPGAANPPIAELAGRTAGAPQRCVSNLGGESLRIHDESRLLYGSGRTLWVNQLRGRCPGLDRMEALIVEPTGSQYCSGDKVRSLDPVTRATGPFCILGDFIPYVR